VPLPRPPRPLDAPFDERIQAMLDAYAEGLRPLRRLRRRALAGLPVGQRGARAARRGVIDHVIRTVHHVDDFTSPSLIECQDRSILEPDQRAVRVAAVGRAAARDYGVRAGSSATASTRAASGPPRDAPSAHDARARAGSATASRC
jgi:hypothetical protein